MTMTIWIWAVVFSDCSRGVVVVRMVVLETHWYQVYFFLLASSYHSIVVVVV